MTSLDKSIRASDPDKKMLALKYLSPQIGKMSSAEIRKNGRTLLLKIHVITGWTMPGKEMMLILCDQFEKKLIESYPGLNTDEIEYAFREYGTIVEDWGKEMNLNLLDKVLIPYINQRLYVSAAEERKKVKPPVQVILTDKQLEDIVRKDIEIFYQQSRNGIIRQTPEYFKEVLVKDGLMKQDDTLANFFADRLGRGFKNIYVPA